MPTARITSGKTGKVYNLNFAETPTQQDVDDALAQIESDSKVQPTAPTVSPTSEQDAFVQQFMAASPGTSLEQAISALVAPAKAGAGLVTGLADIGLKGLQGVGGMAQRSASANELALSQPGFLNRLRALVGEQAGQVGDVLQTAGEVGPRMVAEGGELVRQALANPSILESGRAVVNPLGEAIRRLVAPETAPTQAAAQQAFEQQLVNQAFGQQLQQPILQAAQESIGLPVSTETNIDVARAAPLLVGAETVVPAAIRGTASAVRAASAPIQRAISRSLPATVEQSAMAALDMTAEEAARHIPVVNQRILEISPKAAAPKTASEALKLANEAEASLYQDALVADKAATQQGLAPRADIIISNVEETLNNIPSLLPEERAALLSDARARYTDVSTPAKGRALQQRLNKEFEAQYANDTFDRAAPSNEVKLAVRNSIAQQMDEINKAVTGLDASPYSDIGSLIEFKGNLGKTLQNIQRAEARTKTGIGAPKATNIPTSKAQAIYQTKKSLLSPFQRTQLEKLDSNVSKIFTQGERAGEAIALDPAVQQALIEKYGPRSTPPPLPGTPVANQSLEELIQQTIQALPRELRGRNERAIAESIVRQTQ